MKNLLVFEAYHSAVEMKQHIVDWFSQRGAEWKPPHELKFAIKGGTCRTFFQPWQGGWVLISNLYDNKGMIKNRKFRNLKIGLGTDALDLELQDYLKELDSGLESWVKKTWNRFFDNQNVDNFKNFNLKKAESDTGL